MIHTVAEMLAEIPRLAAEAFATTGTKPVSEQTWTRTVPGPRCLADLDRMLALNHANDSHSLGVLSTWVRAIAEEREEAGCPVGLPDDTTAAACAWISGQLSWSVGRGYESELHADIRRLWTTLRRICKVVDAKPWPCLTFGCRGHMLLVDGMLECEYGHRHDGLRKWRHHASMLDLDLAKQLNMPVSTIRVWKSRGHIRSDAAKTTRAASYVWPWDVLRRRYPDLVETIEHAEDVA